MGTSGTNVCTWEGHVHDRMYAQGIENRPGSGVIYNWCGKVWSYVKGEIGPTGKWQLYLHWEQFFLQWRVVMVMRGC